MAGFLKLVLVDVDEGGLDGMSAGVAKRGFLRGDPSPSSTARVRALDGRKPLRSRNALIAHVRKSVNLRSSCELKHQ